jgi:small multidrug resistance pump
MRALSSTSGPRDVLSVALTCTAASYIAVALIGHYAVNETLTPLHVGAIGLIACGLLMLAFA